MSHTDDFYMILPSNASPRTHPNNNAADYIVTWENPIYLDPDYNWKVAMTEISYIYKPSTLTKSYSIHYIKWTKAQSTSRFEFHCNSKSTFYCLLVDIEKGLPDEKLKEYWPSLPSNFRQALQVHIIDDRFYLQSKYPFSLDFSDREKADWEKKSLKLDHYEGSVINCTYNYNKEMYVLFGARGFTEMKDGIHALYQKAWLERIAPKVIIHHYYPEEFTIDFPEEISFNKIRDLIEYMSNEKFQGVIKDIKYVKKSDRIVINFQPYIKKVHLANGLNCVLGYDTAMIEDTIKKPIFLPSVVPNHMKWYARHPPQLHRGIANMFVYASVCSPIHVGHTQVPLLKNVFIDSSNDANLEGVARNYVVINPMYVPVAASVFNSIEINIRNDSGHLFPFPFGAITTLTIHFKKCNNL